MVQSGFIHNLCTGFISISPVKQLFLFVLQNNISEKTLMFDKNKSYNARPNTTFGVSRMSIKCNPFFYTINICTDQSHDFPEIFKMQYIEFNNIVMHSTESTQY